MKECRHIIIIVLNFPDFSYNILFGFSVEDKWKVFKFKNERWPICSNTKEEQNGIENK